jgi:uncharacterized small protein (DUF1192 family)
VRAPELTARCVWLRDPVRTFYNALRIWRYVERGNNTMSADNSLSPLSLSELEDRIAIVRDNIRQLVEQAAAFSGAADEERNADRIAQQTEELEKLTKERDARLSK